MSVCVSLCVYVCAVCVCAVFVCAVCVCVWARARPRAHVQLEELAGDEWGMRSIGTARHWARALAKLLAILESRQRPSRGGELPVGYFNQIWHPPRLVAPVYGA